MINLDIFNSIKADVETNTRVFTPQKIVKEMIEALPPEVWNSKTTFLDPAVKSGIYLVELFNKLFNTEQIIEDFPNEEDRRKHILTKQLFGIALDDFDCIIAQRNLYGHINTSGNIRTINGYLGKVKSKDTEEYIKAINKEFNMRKIQLVYTNIL